MADSCSLMWRLQIYGGSPPPMPWEEIRDQVAPALSGKGPAFGVAHAAMACAASGSDEAWNQMIDGIKGLASDGNLLASEVTLPLVKGIGAFAQGDYAESARLIGPIHSQFVRLGGSHAQREVFEDTLLAAYMRSEQYGKAEDMLRERLSQRTSVRDTLWLSGVQANTGAALQAGAIGQSDTTEKTETEFMAERGGEVTQTNKKPGAVLKAAASIGVPRSYFIGALKALKGSGAEEPQPAEIDTYIEEQIPLIQKQVQPILDATAEEESTVVVSVYADQAATFITPAPPLEPAEASSVMDFVSANGKQIGLFALAALAMGMMMMMARKSGAPVSTQDEGVAEAVPGGRLGDLYVDDGAVGKAGSPDAFLIAQETDENSIRTRQISKQVSDLINDDPDGAAQLVRRWIEREL